MAKLQDCPLCKYCYVCQEWIPVEQGTVNAEGQFTHRTLAECVSSIRGLLSALCGRVSWLEGGGDE